MERRLSETPRDLIGQLRQRNEKEFACGLVMAVPLRNGEYMIVLLPIQRYTEYHEYIDSEHFNVAFGVHPERGLVFIRGDLAKILFDFSQKAVQEVSLTEPSEIVFPQDFDELYNKFPGKAWRPNVVNLTRIDESVAWGHNFPDHSFKEAYSRALENAGFHVSRVAERRRELTRATSFISST